VPRTSASNTSSSGGWSSAAGGRRRHPEVDHDGFLDECRRPGQGPAVWSDRGAAPVEHQVVVAADLVDVNHRELVLPGEFGQHPLAQALLADRKRRGRHVDEQVGAGPPRLFDRIAVVAAALPEVAIVPDVLADADGDRVPANLDDVTALTGFEVAVFVEDVVGRQERFVEHVGHGPRAQQRRGVEQRTALTAVDHGQADEHGSASLEVGGHRPEKPPRLPDVRRVEQQVARRISAERHLGRDGEVDVATEPSHDIDDVRGVEVERPDGRVQLQEGDAHAAPILPPIRHSACGRRRAATGPHAAHRRLRHVRSPLWT
jgi:hypothetical protein